MGAERVAPGRAEDGRAEDGGRGFRGRSFEGPLPRSPGGFTSVRVTAAHPDKGRDT